MLRLALMLFAVIATTLMGTGVVAVLTMQFNSGPMPLVAAAAAGFVLAIPISWLVAKQLMAARR